MAPKRNIPAKKGKAAELSVVTTDKKRPLFANPALEDYVRTRIRDLQYILSDIENFRAAEELKDKLLPAMGILGACIISLQGVTPDVGLGYQSPDGNPLSSLVGTPAQVPKGGKRAAKAPVVKKAAVEGTDGGVTKTGRKVAVQGGKK